MEEPAQQNVSLKFAVGSSYSQKALLALFEKKIAFEKGIIDIFKGENLDPEFLKLNPEGRVPVLIHGKNIIPDSSKIIEYLDENFSEGDVSRLIPTDHSEETEKVIKISSVLKEIPLPLITFGALYFPELTENSKINPVERENRLALIKKRHELLEDLIEKNPDYASLYLERKVEFLKLKQSVENLDIVSAALDDLEKVLTDVDEQLGSDYWLIGRNFTVADIHLTVLLNRLDNLGLTSRFWGVNKRKNIAKYFKYVQERDSYKSTFKDTVVTGISVVGTSSDAAVSYFPLIIALVVILLAVIAVCAYVKLYM